MEVSNPVAVQKMPWNKGKLVGQKPPLPLKEIWAMRIRLQLAKRARELALFNLALDGKLRGRNRVSLRVGDVVQGSRVSARATVLQRKTQRPVQFELTEQHATRSQLGLPRPTCHLPSVLNSVGHHRLELLVRYACCLVDSAAQVDRSFSAYLIASRRLQSSTLLQGKSRKAPAS